MATVSLAFVLTAGVGASETRRAIEREWRHTDGRTLSGALLGIERGTAILRLEGHPRVAVPLDQLSVPDREWIAAWRTSRSPEEALPPAHWPRAVTRPVPRIEGPVQDGSDFIFRTAHYQFVGDAELSIGAVQEFATVAEATWELLQAWPLPAPGKGDALLTARVFRDREAYHRAGGAPDSAGIFTGGFGRRGALLVPFESLGLESFQGRFTRGAGYRPRILIHEMTHQIYAPLIRFLPLWLNEGLAEYVALVPYQNGTFRPDRDSMRLALSQRLDDYRRRDPGTSGLFGPINSPPERWTLPLGELFALDRSDPGLKSATLVEKHRAYFTALLMVFYFLQCDGDGEARKIRRCFDELDAILTRRRSGGESLPPGWTAEDLFRGRIREKITEQLLDGRTPEQLQVDLRSRLAPLGVKVEFPPTR
jgi:hypothetical protein